MIVTKKKSWLRLIFALRGTSIVNVWPRIGGVLLVSTVVAAFSQAGLLVVSLTTVPFTVVGLALAIFLGFRNNAAYDRYWEGRKLWGSLVNVCRNFAIQTRLIRDVDRETDFSRKELARMTIAYVHCLRHRLRASDPSSEISKFVDDDAELEQLLSMQNVPVAILDKITVRLIDQWNRGNINAYHLSALQLNLEKMLNIQGGCERIQATPIPYSYSVLTHRTVMLYCLALPFGFHDLVGWSMPILTGFVSYAFLSLDDLADEIEQPFGLQPNSLPLHSISRNIEINLLQLLGTPEDQLPDPIAAQNEILI